MSELSSITTEPTPPVAQPADTRSAEERVEELLFPQNKPETARPDAEAGGDAKPASEQDPDKDPETGAEEGEEPAGIDYKQQIPLSNGEKVTLGELKDFYQQQDAKLADLIDRENKVMQQYSELQELGQYLQLPPEKRQQIAQQQAEHLQQQHGLMLAAIPEWKDQAVFEKSRMAIFDLGKEYGVDLTQVTDHKVVKMLHDFARLKGAVKAVKGQVKQVRTPEPKAVAIKPQQGAELATAISTAKKTRNEADQVKAVEMLLRG